MSTTFIFITSAFIISFLVGFICFKLSYERILFKDSFSPMLLVLFTGFVAALELAPTKYDTLSFFSLTEIFIIIGSAAIIYTVSSIRAMEKTTPLFILATAAAYIFLYPSDTTLFNDSIPPIFDKISIILIWALFSFCFKYLNGIDGIISIQTTTIAGGLMILYFIDASPLMLCIFSTILLGASLSFLTFNLHPSYLRLTNGACQALGFIIAWLLVKLIPEQSVTCGLVLSTYFICECIFALFQAALPQNKDKNIYKYTSYHMAVSSGLKASDTAYSIMKITALLIILSGFQAFSANTFSIPALACVTSIWFMHRLINWKDGTKSLKEINKDFISDVKENIDDIKKQITKDK